VSSTNCFNTLSSELFTAARNRSSHFRAGVSSVVEWLVKAATDAGDEWPRVDPMAASPTKAGIVTARSLAMEDIMGETFLLV
jgi:hypothetical protein